MWYKLKRIIMWVNNQEKQARPKWPSERPDIDTYSIAQSTAYPYSWIHWLCVSKDWQFLYTWWAWSTLRQYSMTNKDITTLSQVASISWNSRWLAISRDGYNLYSVQDSSPYVRRLNMSTAWDISTWTVTTNTSGSYQYTWCAVNDTVSIIYRWWDSHASKIYQSTMAGGSISSLSWQEKVISTPTVSGYSCDSVYDIKISPTGKKMFVNQIYNNNNYWCITQYTLSTPRDITTATYDNKMLIIPNNKSRFWFDVDDDWILYAASLGESIIYKYTSSS